MESGEAPNEAAKQEAARLVGEAHELLRTGKTEAAEAAARRATELDPSSSEAENVLGTALVARGEVARAERAYRRAIELAPGSFKPLTNLGHLLSKRADHRGAVEMFVRSIATKPDAWRAHAGLGAALLALDRGAEARESFERSMAIEPNPGAALGLFEVEARRGEIDEARSALARARDLFPADPRLASAEARLAALSRHPPERLRRLSRARALVAAGHDVEAARVLEEVLGGQPRPDDALSIEGRDLLWGCYGRLGDRDGVARTFARALAQGDAISVFAKASLLGGIDEEARSTIVRGAAERSPERVDLAEAAAIDLLRCRQIVAAEAHLGRALARHPSSEALGDLRASVLVLLGRQSEAVALDRARLSRPGARPTPNGLLRLHYAEGTSRREVRALHERWAAALGDVPRFEHAEAKKRGDRRLRVGYLSGDLYQHSVGRLLLPLLVERDTARIELFAYATNPKRDALTQRIEALVDRFRGVWTLDDADLARAIRDDDLDVLVELSGHTAMSRLEVLARRPARVQVSYLGYPATTGLSEIDYRITDADADPEGAEEDYVERLIRLPRTAWCFAPEGLPVAPPRGEGPIVFGSFNSVAKVTPAVVARWASIVRQVPSARLLLKSTNLLEPAARDVWRGHFERAGLEPSRVEVLGYEPDPSRHLETYGRVDVALDPFPYDGTMTTCEALAMGVPVVTLAGDRHVSRVGVSLLSAVGLRELVASSLDEYERIALDLATDPARLERARATLRSGYARSELADARGFARAFEDALESAALSGPANARSR